MSESGARKPGAKSKPAAKTVASGAKSGKAAAARAAPARSAAANAAAAKEGAGKGRAAKARAAKGSTTKAAPASGLKAGRRASAVQAPVPLVAWPLHVRAIAAQLLGLVGSAAELSLGVGNALVRRPAHWRALQKAGAFLRDARETAGLTVAEVSTAIDLKDPEMLDLAENGKMVLPFEVLLRLAALLARNDPVPFLMQLARNYSPSLWKALEELGVARLVLHAGREHEFINVYRSRDAARRLSDEEFEKVLAFTDAAFGMALDLATMGRIPSPPRRG